MRDPDLQWRDNIRTNLVLWPEVGANLSGLAAADGRPYDEASLLGLLPQREGKAPNDSRAVRNTFEILALAGLAHRSESGEFQLSPLGRCAFTYLLPPPQGSGVANPVNIHLLGRIFMRGLNSVPEYRAIWSLMALTQNRLTNEELNRAIPLLGRHTDIDRAADAVRQSREQSDPRVIGPRFYRDEDYGTGREADQRKVMNVLFLLAGGGGIIIEMGDDRRLAPWAQELLPSLSAESSPVRASTDREAVLRISKAAAPPSHMLDPS